MESKSNLDSIFSDLNEAQKNVINAILALEYQAKDIRDLTLDKQREADMIDRIQSLIEKEVKDVT